MADTAIKNKNGSVKWIVVLCVTAVLAIVGWTTTVTLAARMRAMELLNANVLSLNIRTSVLENKYDTIQIDLVEIKMILQKLRDNLE